jgi:glutathionylspermidine synthase
MRRVSLHPRPDWPAQVEALGLTYHSADGQPYWDEAAAYEFTAREIATLEAATAELQAMCLEAAEVALRENWRTRLHLSEAAWAEIQRSWDRDDLSLYGRFDLLWDGTGPPKLLEYNADTPTSLLEAAVIQWQWLEQTRPQLDQFNSIHDALLASWPSWPQEWIHFTTAGAAEEDWRTLLYLEDTCRQAGKLTTALPLEELGFDPTRRRFVGQQHEPLEAVFKLYPWEWLWQEEFAAHLPGRTQLFLEPVWKMLWSTKALLVLLWEVFPDHPYLLPASFDAASVGPEHVLKPFWGREGANVRMIRHGRETHRHSGPWGDQPLIAQALHPPVTFAGHYPVLGSWIIGGEPAGVGMREDHSPITTNRSRFVPHYFRPSSPPAGI